MKTTTRRLLTRPALITASLISMTAAAAGPQLVDIDGNGLISAEEITQIRDEYKATELASYDTDGDGQLSREEHDVIRSERESLMLMDYDADGDGQLSRDEHQAVREAQLASIELQLDVNQDGILSDEERAGFDALPAEMEEPQAPRGGGRGGKRGS